MNQNLKLTLFGIAIVIVTVASTLYISADRTQAIKDVEQVISKKDARYLTQTPIDKNNTKPNMNKTAQTGDQIVVHYTGKFSDGKKFDSSLDRGEPFPFILGAGQVIKGWDEGLMGVSIGDKKTLVIPPEKAYGANGRGTIPPNSTLTFDIEVVDIIRAVSLKNL